MTLGAAMKNTEESLAGNGVIKGEPGEKGEPGFSPIVTITDIEGGHNVAIEDVNGVKNFEVLDGKDAEQKIYTTIGDLGLTAPVKVGDIFNAMDDKTIAMIACEGTRYHITDIPGYYGILTIKRAKVGRFSIEFQSSSGVSATDVKRWIGTLKGTDGTELTWKLISTQTTYVALSDMELTAEATVQDVIDALPIGCTALLKTDEFTNWSTLFNDIQYGYLKIEKTVNGLSNIELQEVVTPNRKYFGTQSSGKFAGWVSTTGTKGLVSNAQNFKIDLTKNNAAWYGFFKLEYLYGTELCQVDVGITNAIDYKVTKGTNYIDKITYTVNGTSIVLGIDFIGKVYGVQVVEMPSEFGTINSLTAETYAGDTSANLKLDNARTYTTLAELGLDNTATIDDVRGAIPVGGTCMIRTDAFADLTQFNGIQWGYLKITVTTNKMSDIWLNDVTSNKALYYGRQSNGKFDKWVKVITENSNTDPYSCTGYKVLTGTEDLFTLPCGHYVSDKVNTTYNYPITDSSNVTAHIYVLGCLNDPANNKGYRVILYFDNKGRMYNINEWWGSFSNGWQNHSLKTYTDVQQLGLTKVCSVVDIYKALPINSEIICASYGDANHQGGYITGTPAGHGVLEIKKSGYDGCRATMTFTESATSSMGYKRKWVAEFASSPSDITPDKIKWHEVAYKTVADVGLTTINQTNGLTAPTGITMTDGSKVNYCIRNGVCYVHIALQISSISAKVNSWTTIADLPKSVIEAVGTMNCEGNTVPDCMPIRVSQAGKLTLMYKGATTSTSDWWSYSFSYPVTE